jgi:hypothetical protein
MVNLLLRLVLIVVMAPLLPDLPDGTIYGLGEVVEGRAFRTFGAGEAALGGAPELANGAVQVLRFLQHGLGFQQNWAGRVWNASRLGS